MVQARLTAELPNSVICSASYWDSEQLPRYAIPGVFGHKSWPLATISLPPADQKRTHILDLCPACTTRPDDR